MAKINDPFKPSGSGIVDPYASPATPAAPAEVKPKGVTAADYMRTLGGSVVTSVGGAVRGAAESLRSAVRTDTPGAALVSKAGDAIGKYGSEISQGVSQSAAEAMASSTPTGSITDPSSWSFGSDPSLAGYALQATQGLGSTVPTLAAGAITKGKLAPSAAVAASAGGGFAAQQEQQRILDMPEEQLAQVPEYATRLQTMDAATARASLAQDAANSAFRYTAPVSAADALLEVAPFTGAVQKALAKAVGPGRLARTAAGSVTGALGEAAQEVGEQAAQTTGANVVTGENRDPLEDSLANATLGALVGGPINAAAALSTSPAAAAADIADDGKRNQSAAAQMAGEPQKLDEVKPVPVETQTTIVDPADGPLSRAVATDSAIQTGGPVQPVAVTTQLADEAALEQNDADTQTAAKNELKAEEAAAAGKPPAKKPKPAAPAGVDPETGEDTRPAKQPATRADIDAALQARAGGIIEAKDLRAIAAQLGVPVTEVAKAKSDMRKAQLASPAATAAPTQEDIFNETDVRTEEGGAVRQPERSAADGRDGSSTPGTVAGSGKENGSGQEEGNQEGRGEKVGKGGRKGRQEGRGQEGSGQEKAGVSDLTVDPTPEPLDGDITPPSGSPWTIRKAAELAVKRHPGAEVIELADGGFVLRTQTEKKDAVPNDARVDRPQDTGPVAGGGSTAAAGTAATPDAGNAAGKSGSTAGVDAAPGSAAVAATPKSAKAPVPAGDGVRPGKKGLTNEQTQLPDGAGAGAGNADGGKAGAVAGSAGNVPGTGDGRAKPGTGAGSDAGLSGAGASEAGEVVGSGTRPASVGNDGPDRVVPAGKKAAFKSAASVNVAIKALGQQPGDYEIRKEAGGFVGVRKSAAQETPSGPGSKPAVPGESASGKGASEAPGSVSRASSAVEPERGAKGVVSRKAVAVAEEVSEADLAARKNRNRTPPAVEGDTWDTGKVLREKPVGGIVIIEDGGPNASEDGATRWKKLKNGDWTDGATTLDTNAMQRRLDNQGSESEFIEGDRVRLTVGMRKQGVIDVASVAGATVPTALVKYDDGKQAMVPHTKLEPAPPTQQEKIYADFAANRQAIIDKGLKKGMAVKFPNGEKTMTGTIRNLGDKDQAVITVDVPGARGVADFHVPATRVTPVADDGQQDELDSEMRSYEAKGDRAAVLADLAQAMQGSSRPVNGVAWMRAVPGKWTDGDRVITSEQLADLITGAPDANALEGDFIRVPKSPKESPSDPTGTPAGKPAPAPGSRIYNEDGSYYYAPKAEKPAKDAKADAFEDDLKQFNMATYRELASDKARTDYRRGYAAALNGDKLPPEAVDNPALDKGYTFGLRRVSGKREAESKPAVSANKVFTEDAAAAARKLLKGKLNQLSSGVDPELLQAGLTLAGYHIEKGARTFAAYAKAMIDDLGDGVKPFLKSWYLGVKFDPRAALFDGMDKTATVEDADVDALTAQAETEITPTEESDNERVQPGPAESRGPESLENPPAEAVRGDGKKRAAGKPADRSGAKDAGTAGRGEPGRPDGRGSVARGKKRVPDSGPEPSPIADLFSSVTEKPQNTAVQQPAGASPVNFHITEDVRLGEGGQKGKFNGNMAAIKLLKELEETGRTANPSEQATLARYVGWGGIPQAFIHPESGKISTGWEKQAPQLREALTDAEYDAAMRSTQDAHYTSPTVVAGMYDAVKRLGITGGTILEPSMGTGNFLGLAPDSLRGSLHWTGIELDSITGRIATQLYPQARVIAGRGFQEVTVPENHFDAAMGNPPFGSTVLFDPKNPDLKGFSIHNFFFAKTLKSIKPGGVMAMVVSHQFMDKATSKQRKWMADRARLLGAIRLPDTAFKANAGTEVTTDIVFLQKLHPGESADTSWTAVGTVPDPAGGTPIPLNQYFVDNPGMLLGDMTRKGSMRSADMPTLTAREGADLAAELRAAVQNLPQNVVDAPRIIAMGETAPASDLADSAPVYGHYITPAGKIRQRLPDVLDERVYRDVEVAGKEFDRLAGLIGLRDQMKALMRAEMTEATTASMDGPRKALNKAYDKFVKEFGYLNSQKNVAIFREDADAYRVRALEVGYTKMTAEEAEAEGLELPKGRKTLETATKADLLSKRVLNPTRTVKAATAQDALIVSLNTNGRVDMDSMAMMLNSTEAKIVEELGGKLFLDPDGGYQTDDAYLSGNVKAKLARAQAAAKQDAKYDRNVEALLAVQPPDLSPADISVSVGAPWVPGTDYAQFAADVLDIRGAKIRWNGTASKFSMQAQTRGNERFGTARASAYDLFQRALNHQPGTIFDTVYEEGKEKRVANPEATTAATAKIDEIKEAFGDWIFKDQVRRDRLAQFYNDTYNTDRARTYDGSFLTFPGMTDQIKLRPSQKNAIWRMVQDGRILLDHVVGAGKTYTIVAAAMTAKRMGLQNKPMISVPNHLVEQWAGDFLRLYPGARILAVTKADFDKDRRKVLFSRIATGDWDAVIVAHSQFTRISVPAEFEKEYLAEQIDLYAEAMDAAKADRDQMTIKNLKARRDRLESKLKARMERTTRDTDTAYLDEMGIDAIYKDEAHEFKNLEFVTTKRNVSGMGNPAGSQKAADLFMKTRYMLRANGGRGVYFATGTPVSNSLAEMFTMQRYLAEDDLKGRGIHTFDAWANTFAQEEVQFQIDSTGRGLKPKTVLTKFVNVAEMMAIYWRFADIVLQGDLNRVALETTGKPFPVPKVKGGGPQNVVVKAGRALSLYIERDIIPRTQAISGEPSTWTDDDGQLVTQIRQKPDPSEDNMLKVTNDARLAALDVRLRVPSAPDDPNSKVNEAVANVFKKWQATKKQKGTQLIFCDLSTPKAAVAKERAELQELIAAAEGGDEDAQIKLDKMSPDEFLALESAFSVYDDVKAKLIGMGIPPQEIAFIHDAKTDLQKKALFTRMRNGNVRVLMGSTPKMGAGTNVQDKLVALHHLDAPWRPSDLEQREGRIIRQGNEFYAADPDGFEVEIHRYATERTYDSRMWQLIEQKAAVVEQIRMADAGTREIDDIGGQAANAAEMKAAATGNPLIIEQVELQDKVKRLGMLKKSYDGRIYDAERRLASLNADGGPDGRAARELAKNKPLQDFHDAHPQPKGDAFTITVGGKEITEHARGANALALAIIDADGEMDRTARQRIPVATFRGMEISLAKGRLLNQRVLEARIPELGEQGELGMLGTAADEDGKVSGAGVITRANNVLNRVTSEPAQIERERKDEIKRIGEWEDVLAQPFKQGEDFAKAKARLAEVNTALQTKAPAAPAAPLEAVLEPEPAQSRPEARKRDITTMIVGPNDLTKHVAKIVGSWTGDIPTVRVIESASALPDIARRQAGWETAEGWYDGRGVIYLVSENIANLSRASQVLAHEAFGHYGVEGIVGKAGWTQIVGDVARLRKNPGKLKADMAAAMASAERRYGGENSSTFAREYLAIMAERGVKNMTLARVMAAVRKWVRDVLKINIEKWGDAELRDIVARGMRQVRVKGISRQQADVRGPAQGRAYHGTPTRGIEETGFRMSAIGTGEGYQAYGHGMYFASQQAVADHYRRTLTGIDGKRVSEDDSMFARRSDSYQDIIDSRVRMIERLEGKLEAATEEEEKTRFTGYVKHARAELASLQNQTGVGQLYEVTIPDEDVLLDWDKPLAEQPEAVRTAFESSPDLAGLFDGTGLSQNEEGELSDVPSVGRDAYQRLAQKLGSEQAASHALFVAGIPGSQFLDGQSRSPSAGTKNYVIWDEDAVQDVRGLFSLPDTDPNTLFQRIAAAGTGNDGVVQRIKDKLEDVRPALLAGLTTRQLADVAGGYLPAAEGYLALVDRMAARRNALQAEVGDLATDWQKMQAADRRKATAAQKAARDTDSDRFTDLAHDSTIAGVDGAEAFKGGTILLNSNGDTVDLTPQGSQAAIDRINATLDEIRLTTPETTLSQNRVRVLLSDRKRIEMAMEEEAARIKAYPGLKQRFDALPEPWKQKYREIRDAYAKRAEQMLDALLARIEALEIDDREKAALVQRMRANYESARVHAPYFPLARFGDYWVSFERTNEKGEIERQFVMAETKRERDRAVKAGEAAGFTVAKMGRKIENVRAQDGASGTFVSNVNEVLATAGVKEDVRDEIYQLYLRTLPDLSTRKSFIHRKKVAGYDNDALRAFAGQMFHGAHQLAKLEFAPRLSEALDSIVKNAKDAQEVASEDADRASVAAGEFKKRHEWILNPTNASWVQSLSAANFVFYLGLSPGAALVNMTQTAITTFPALAAKHGAMKAMQALADAMKDAIRTLRFGDKGGIRSVLRTDEERAAYDQLQLMGAIDVTQTHDLAGLGETDTKGYSSTQHRVMNVVSGLFHKAEVVNREASGMAAYRLARGDGKSHEEAIKAAADTIWDTHFDYSAANRARFMQGNAAKVLFAFKQYSQSMTYYLWRAFYQATKGDTPAVRKEARNRLLGTLGMTGVFAGVMGMPLLSVAFSVANAAAAAFGDDDDPWDAETEFRNFIADMLGPKLGGIAQEGLVEGGLEALGISAPEIGSRVSLDELWIRNPDQDTEGRDLYVHLLEQVAGPIAGMIGSQFTGASMIGEGLNTDNNGLAWRGVEKMMPKALRDGMKALRFGTQGVNTIRGDALIDDPSLIDSLYQGIGLAPAEVSRQYDANRSAKKYEKYIMDRRGALLDAYALATKERDTEAARETLEKIRAFNRKNPGVGINANTIRRSLLSRAKFSEKAVNGITLNPKLARRLEGVARFADQGDEEE